mmetsp:Transcript_72810/g.201861  ORF Transcript_72810/g.201861 Transcript_72810/m.201861 type:complete len:293 (+) Transcript_72810:206-1084(+)
MVVLVDPGVLRRSFRVTPEHGTDCDEREVLEDDEPEGLRGEGLVLDRVHRENRDEGVKERGNVHELPHNNVPNADAFAESGVVAARQAQPPVHVQLPHDDVVQQGEHRQKGRCDREGAEEAELDDENEHVVRNVPRRCQLRLHLQVRVGFIRVLFPLGSHRVPCEEPVHASENDVDGRVAHEHREQVSLRLWDAAVVVTATLGPLLDEEYVNEGVHVVDEFHDEELVHQCLGLLLLRSVVLLLHDFPGDFVPDDIEDPNLQRNQQGRAVPDDVDHLGLVGLFRLCQDDATEG